eukprot:6176716-Pleurochrysis_carterae.AAC.1
MSLTGNCVNLLVKRSESINPRRLRGRRSAVTVTMSNTTHAHSDTARATTAKLQCTRLLHPRKHVHC